MTIFQSSPCDLHCKKIILILNVKDCCFYYCKFYSIFFFTLYSSTFTFVSGAGPSAGGAHIFPSDTNVELNQTVQKKKTEDDTVFYTT